MKRLLIFMLAIVFFTCDDENITRENVISFEGLGNIAVDVPANSVDFDYPISIYTNFASTSDRQFNVVLDLDNSTLGSENYSIPTTFTMPANALEGQLIVTFDDVSIDFTPQAIALKLESDNDTFAISNDDANNNIFLNVVEECTGTFVQLAITLDTWPDETTWQLVNLDSGSPVVLFSGGPFVNPDDDFATIDYEFCLLPGNYGIVVFDSYGDGITNGGYEITSEGVVLASGVVTSMFGSSTFSVE